MDTHRKFRALVVDDRKEIRDLVRWELSREDIVCEEAEDGVVASDMISAKHYDAVICDLLMPRKHGHKLIVELARQDTPPVVVVITGVLEPRLFDDLFARGVDDILLKPLPTGIFGAKIKSMLARRKAQQRVGNAESRAADVAQNISQATASLRSQLAGIQQSFQKTIADLETQRDKLEAGYLGSIRMLANLIIQAGDPQGSHPVRVERMVTALGTEAGLNRADLMDLKIAALLHEIGQIGLPDSMRTKAPWEMSPQEREAYKKYPAIGALLLSEVPSADGVVSVLESHMENFDGTGFPAGFRGTEIPLSARILRVADGLDTCLMHTSSTSAVETGMDHLYAEQGKSYDPTLVKMAVTCFRESVTNEKEELIETISVSDLRSGLTIAENVHDELGHLLVRKGIVVTERIAAQLQRLVRFQEVKVVAQNTSPRAQD